MVASNLIPPYLPASSYSRSDDNFANPPGAPIGSNSSSAGGSTSSNSSSGAASQSFSPAVIAIIVILGAAFLLVTCYTIMAKLGTPWEVFRRRRWRRQVAGATVDDDDDNNPAAVTWPLMEVQQGLEEAVIQAIPVCEYRKEEGRLPLAVAVARVGGGSDCAVCLSEFEEGERVRMLPKCSHAFHLPCIDMWLRSHSNCPLCRANITSPAPDPPPPHATEINPQPPSSAPTIDDDAALQDPGHHLHIIDENTQGEEADTPLTRLRPLNREHKTIPLISRQPHDHATDGLLADQIERASLQLGSGFRCFSTGRASLSFRCFSTGRSFGNDGHESERLADLTALGAANSSTVNTRMTRSSSLGFCMDNMIHVLTDDYRYHTREGDHRVIDLNHHEKVVLDTVHNINRLESSSNGGSSSTSEGMRDFKSKSLNHDNSELKSLKAESIEDPLMGRMVLSLKGPRAVKRSFSGGRLFGFKVQKNSTSISVGTSTEAASRLPI